jgi:hypothetical protein
MKVIVPHDLILKSGTYDSADAVVSIKSITDGDSVLLLDFTVEAPDVPPPDDKPVDPPAVIAPPIKVPPPESVQLLAKFADGTTSDVTAAKGQRVPLVPGNPRYGSLMYHADGLTACIENAYCQGTNDLTGNFTLKAGDAVLADGPLTIFLRTAEPFWLATPAVIRSPDLSMFPKYGPGAEGVEMDATACYWEKRMENQGERADLGGGLDQFSATYIKNPSANNAAVILNLADQAARFPYRAIDFATGKMVSLANNPNISYLPQIAGEGLVPKYSTACTYSVDQGSAHAPPLYALACAIFGTDYHKDGLSQWANFVGSLWQNWSYRLPSGYFLASSGQTRAKGRALTTVLYASKLSDNPAYFKAWASSCAADMNTAWDKQTGVHVDYFDAEYLDYMAFAPYQQWILIDAMGRALDFGYNDIQKPFDYFCVTLLDSVLSAQIELATIYAVYYRDPATGALLPTWAAGLNEGAKKDTKLAAALLCAEGSQAMQTALGTGGKPGDIPGYTTSPQGYPAQLWMAIVAACNHCTDQTRAQAARAKFETYGLPRIDFSQNPKYNYKPRVSA